MLFHYFQRAILSKNCSDISDSLLWNSMKKRKKKKKLKLLKINPIIKSVLCTAMKKLNILSFLMQKYQFISDQLKGLFS
ncbi:unnamed protein product [Rhizophagus irregularis]|nr:unnamed protein product [Rhizophagus irregularis]